MIRCQFSVSTLAAVLAWLTSTGVLGGAGLPAARAAPQDDPALAAAGANEVTNFAGKLKSVRGDVMTITRDDGVDVLVQFPDSPTDFVFVAKALPAYLQRGMWVRFKTTLAANGMPESPVAKLELFAPVNANLLKGHQRSNFNPGVHSADRAKPRGNAPLTGPVIVVGQLMMLNAQGGLAVQAGNVPVQTIASPEVAIEVRFNNLALAQEGDSVNVAGFYQPPDDTKVKADRITIKTDRVYGEKPEPKSRRQKRDPK